MRNRFGCTRSWRTIDCRSKERGEGLFSKGGFTLLELVIAAALTGVVFVMVAQALAQGVKAYNRQDTRSELFQMGRVALDRISRELRSGGAPTVAPSEISFPFDSDDDDVFDATLRFSKSGDQIQRQVDAEPVQVLAEEVSTLSFEGVDLTTIRLVLESGEERVELQTAVRHAN
jgi:prepilin-type N-terminal cleavage/methylation domain-containing protein